MENLQESHISSILVVGRLPLDEVDGEQLSESFTRHQENWRRRPIDKLGLYEVDGTKHHIGLDIELGRATRATGVDSALFSLEAHPFSRHERLRTAARTRQERQFDEIQAILSDCKELTSRGRLHSHVSWTFPPDSKRPIISLPLMTVQDPSFPFAEISGIRLRKRTEDGLTSVTIDLREDRSLTVTLVCPLTRVPVTSDMVNYAARTGNKMIADFVSSAEVRPENGEVTA